MNREVVTEKDIIRINKSGSSSRIPSEATYPAGKDTYSDRLFKYIPAEIVAGYIFVLGAVKQLTDKGESVVILWVLFGLFSLLTPLYLWKVQKVRKISQHIISLASFIIWVFALGGPFTFYSWYNPVYGAIILPVFTIIIAIWEAE